MKLITASAFAALITAAAATGNATTAVVGGDQGHEQVASETQDACAFAFNSGPAVMCTNSFAASGTTNWQIALPVSAASSTLTTVTATATAQVPVAASNPNQIVTGRLLSWNLSGTLLCSTSTVTWGQSSSPVAHSLGSCFSVNPTTDRPEAEFFLGHIQGQALSLMPRVYGVSYSY